MNAVSTFRRVAIAAGLLMALPLHAAGDATSNVPTGGIAGLKNYGITMRAQDLLISKNRIRAAYEFFNNSGQDIRETVFLPLPPVSSDMFLLDFADTGRLTDSLRIWVDEREISPQVHTRAFMCQPDWRGECAQRDVTEDLQRCGLSERELQHPWRYRYGSSSDFDDRLDDILDKISACDAPEVVKALEFGSGFYSQIVYSWDQSFKAGKTTHIRHQYEPLLGGTFAMSFASDGYGDMAKSFIKPYCIEKGIVNYFSREGRAFQPQDLGYILTDENRAEPIADFKLTVQRDENEFVSFCWQGEGKVKALGDGRFEIREKDFVPTHDLNILFLGKETY